MSSEQAKQGEEEMGSTLTEWGAEAVRCPR